MVIGALADTHIPDRLAGLPAGADSVLREHSVSAILHAGDICRPATLRDLSAIAPVIAVRGNRDVLWPANWRLPGQRVLEFGGVTIGLTHGHPALGVYLRQKLLPRGQFDAPEIIEQRLVTRFSPAVSAIVYGHSHLPRVMRVHDTLMINPGSLAPPHFTIQGATLALLRIGEGGIEAEIVSVR